jgi:hypothetical protein
MLWYGSRTRIHAGNACFPTQVLLSSNLLSITVKVKTYNKTVVLPVVLYGCETVSCFEGNT